MILIMILAAFITMSNYSKKRNLFALPYLAEEIQIESEKVMDYNLITGNDKLENFTEEISKYAGEDTKIYFITGQDSDIKFYYYEDDAKVSLTPIIEKENKKITATIYLEDDGTPNNYEFPLTKGENFYFIIVNEYKGEKYVYANN